jgi:hypothetical protein
MRCSADAGASPSEDYYYSDDDTYVAFGSEQSAAAIFGFLCGV